MNVNKKAPDIELLDHEGNTTTLASYKGKWVVLYFYPKDNTPGCTREAIDFTAYKKKFAAKNAVVIGISRDTPSCHLKFMEKQKLDLILLSDPDKSAHEQYGVWKMKKLYGKESMGAERSTFLINPEGIVAHIWRSVKVDNHAEAVLEKLKELSK